MAEFGSALSKTLRYEGGWCNIENDPGGETYKGISRVYHPDWAGWEIVDRLKDDEDFPNCLEINLELSRMVNGLYLEKYWEKMRLGELDSQMMADSVFDYAVHKGVFRSGKMLQETVNSMVPEEDEIAEDGIMGPITIEAVNEVCKDYEEVLLIEFNAWRVYGYFKSCAYKPRKRVFLKGWVMRALKNVG